MTLRISYQTTWANITERYRSKCFTLVKLLIVHSSSTKVRERPFIAKRMPTPPDGAPILLNYLSIICVLVRANRLEESTAYTFSAKKFRLPIPLRNTISSQSVYTNRIFMRFAVRLFNLNHFPFTYSIQIKWIFSCGWRGGGGTFSLKITQRTSYERCL